MGGNIIDDYNKGKKRRRGEKKQAYLGSIAIGAALESTSIKAKRPRLDPKHQEDGPYGW